MITASWKEFNCLSLYTLHKHAPLSPPHLLPSFTEHYWPPYTVEFVTPQYIAWTWWGKERWRPLVKLKGESKSKRVAWKSTAKQKMKDLSLIPTVRLEDKHNKAGVGILVPICNDQVLLLFTFLGMHSITALVTLLVSHQWVSLLR